MSAPPVGYRRREAFKMTVRSKTPRGFRRLVTSALAVVAAAPAAAMAASASLNSGLSSATRLHHPGSGSPGTVALPIQSTSSPSMTYSSTLTFTGGSTKGKAAVGRTQSSTVAKLVFPTGVGVDQTDPGHVQPASAVRIDFSAIFDITGSGSFGPSINGVFSVPFGATIAPGGAAEFQCHINWDAKIIGQNSNNFFQVRPDYVVTPGSGGLFTNNTQSTQSVLTSFTAPAAPFSPSSIAGGAGHQLRVSGFVQFAANNDDGPVTGLFPRDAADGTDPNDVDPFAFYQPKNADEERILQLIPEAGFEVVPEPASGVLFAGGTALLLVQRRRRRQGA